MSHDTKVYFLDFVELLDMICKTSSLQYQGIVNTIRGVVNVCVAMFYHCRLKHEVL